MARLSIVLLLALVLASCRDDEALRRSEEGFKVRKERAENFCYENEMLPVYSLLDTAVIDCKPVK